MAALDLIKSKFVEAFIWFDFGKFFCFLYLYLLGLIFFEDYSILKGKIFKIRVNSLLDSLYIGKW